jgi:hypothetical protein
VQVGNGVWGVDFDEDQSVVLSGVRSIKFLATTPYADPYFDDVEPKTIEEGAAYPGEVTWRANSIAAGHTMRAEIRWMDATHTDLSQDVIHDGVLAAADTWETRRATFEAPAGARFARMRISKNNLAFKAWVDGYDMLSSTPHLDVSTSGSQSVASGVTTNMIMDVVGSKLGIGYEPTTGIATILSYGVYAFTFYGEISGIFNGCFIEADIPGSAYPIAYNRQYNWSGGSLNLFPSAAGTSVLSAGQTAQMRVFHDNGTHRSVSSRMTITRIE